LNGRNTQHPTGGVEHQPELTLTYQPLAQNVPAERLGAARVARGDESNELLSAQGVGASPMSPD
jgi:hypothetical protein